MSTLNEAFGLESSQLCWGLDTGFKEILAQNALICKPTKKAKTFPFYDGKQCLFARASRGDKELKILVEEVREVVFRPEITPTGAFDALKEKLLTQNIRAGAKSSWQGTKGYLYILQGQVVDGKQTVPFDFNLGVPRTEEKEASRGQQHWILFKCFKWPVSQRTICQEAKAGHWGTRCRDRRTGEGSGDN